MGFVGYKISLSKYDFFQKNYQEFTRKNIKIVINVFSKDDDRFSYKESFRISNSASVGVKIILNLAGGLQS